MDLVVIKDLLGHAHLGVTATVHTYVRLRLQRRAIDTLSNVLRAPTPSATELGDGDELPLCAEVIRQSCRQGAQKPRQSDSGGTC
ncbi:hypothetical protein AQ490_26400 [Wenjunlia vitaminophila]|uniref:Uncharacterized protein n=1 Tax=Wenjunlia vitaminophila TaxID=76728 RepID=A0A0T6LQ08_WENVI|nr:hypothetical protein AQ490_26400 [Wenjunlia vitaminophila]